MQLWHSGRRKNTAYNISKFMPDVNIRRKRKKIDNNKPQKDIGTSGVRPHSFGDGNSPARGNGLTLTELSCFLCYHFCFTSEDLFTFIKKRRCTNKEFFFLKRWSRKWGSVGAGPCRDVCEEAAEQRGETGGCAAMTRLEHNNGNSLGVFPLQKFTKRTAETSHQPVPIRGGPAVAAQHSLMETHHRI